MDPARPAPSETETSDVRRATLPATAALRAIAETLAALANANGGYLRLRDAALGDGADLILHACLLCDPPLILPAPQPAGAGDLLVEVPPGLPNVYNVGGLYLTRSGGHNRPLSTPELRRLLLERGEGAYEAEHVEGARLDDLDPACVARYFERLLLAPGAGLDGAGIETLLARGCLVRLPGASEPVPTVAGLLIFGAAPQQFLRSAEILCVRYPGTQMADEFVRQEIGGPLPDQIHQAEAFVAANITYAARLDGLVRREVPALPPAVVREAIVNAVAHRDYRVRGDGVRLLLFANRLEVYSPGRLPGHVTLENLKDERFSRNEALVALLSDLGYIERLGYGIDRMFATLREHGLPDPRFEETAAGFRVTLLMAPEPAAPAAVAIPPLLPAGEVLNERQQTALRFLAEHGRITNSDLQEMAPAVSAETIRRDLADLVERNLLLRIGAKRATYYILK